jgi:hypothetical protein
VEPLGEVVNANFAAAPMFTVKELEIADVRLPSVAVSV